MFNLLNTRRIARKIADEELDQAEEKLLVILFAVTIICESMFYSWVGGSKNQWWDYVTFAVLVVIYFVGIYHCFNANGATSGRDFARRYLLLSAPLYVKFALAWAVIFAIAWELFPRLITGVDVRSPEFIWYGFFTIVNIVLPMLYFERMIYYFRAIRTRQTSVTKA